MIKTLWSIFFAAMLLPMCSFAQLGQIGGNNPVKWSFSVKKLDDGQFKVEAKATIEEGFHIWALDAGGDGTLIATSFTTDDLDDASWKDEWQEEKKPKVEKLDFIEGAIRWHEKSIVFYRVVKAQKGASITGSVEYQTCNERMCLPPAIEDFSLLIP